MRTKQAYIGKIGQGCRLKGLRGRGLYLSEKLMSTPFPFSQCEFGACTSSCCHWGCRLSMDDLADIGPFLSEVYKSTGLRKAAISIDLNGRPGQPGYDAAIGFINSSVSTGGCLMLDPARQGGCRLHAEAIQRGLNWRAMKPFTCVLYPVRMRYLDPGEQKDILLAPSREHSICPGLTHRRNAPRSPLTYYEAKRQDIEFLFDIEG